MRTPGGIIFAHPRFGKTYGVRYVMQVLKEDYPKAVILSFGCQKKKTHSEDAFFSVLLEAAAHSGALTGSITKKRSKLNDRILELVDRSGHNWFVMFADEAQRLDVIEYEWLRDVHDELERRGVRMSRIYNALADLMVIVNISELMGSSRGLNMNIRFATTDKPLRGFVQEFGLLGVKKIGLAKVNDSVITIGFNMTLFPKMDGAEAEDFIAWFNSKKQST